MLPRQRKGTFLDKLHKFGVYSCMALTMYGLALGSYKVYYYINYTKPALREKREALKRELLAESNNGPMTQ